MLFVWMSGCERLRAVLGRLCMKTHLGVSPGFGWDRVNFLPVAAVFWI